MTAPSHSVAPLVPSAAAVFVSGGMPHTTYVRREDSNIERIISQEIDQGFRAVFLIGPPASGKTTACRMALSDYDAIWVDGGQISSLEDLWAELTVLVRQRYPKPDIPISSNRETNFWHREKRADVLDALRRNSIILVIDDIQCMPEDVRQGLDRSLKPRLYEGLRALLIGTKVEAVEGFMSNDGVNQRAGIITMPAWTVEELCLIGRAGFRELRMPVSSGVLGELARGSQSSPLVMQQLCYRLSQLMRPGSAEITKLSVETRRSLFGSAEHEREYLSGHLPDRIKDKTRQGNLFKRLLAAVFA